MDLALGIDIGGTSTKVALVDTKGAIVERDTFGTQRIENADHYLTHLLYTVANLFRRLEREFHLVGIGVGAPSCNEAAGTIEGAANLPFGDHFPIVSRLREQYELPVYLIKDSSAALLGESAYGAAIGVPDFILLTLGTGLGCAIMANGRLIRGASGMAGELGHVPVSGNLRECGCGKRGCLETYVSAVGLKRTVLALQAEDLTPSQLRTYTYDQLDARHISRAAMQGDLLARRAFERTGEVLGQKLAELVSVLEPQAIVLAGGMAEAGQLLIEPLQRHMEKALLGFHQNRVQILTSSLAPNDAALLGAASLVWNSHQPVSLS